MRTFNWGIIGTGYIAGKFCDSLKLLDGCAKIAAVCSRSEEKGAAFANRYGCEKVYTSVNNMCADPDVEIIYVATPHTEHYSNIITAAGNGKNILCEKPMTINAAQAKRCFEEAEKNGVFLMEAMWTRFLPPVKKALEWAKTGRIGTVRRVQSCYHGSRVDDPASRLNDPKLGGGSLLDLGVYPLFAANLFLEGMPEVQDTACTMTSTGVDRTMTARLSYNGLEANISCGFDYPACQTVVEGDDGFIVVPDWAYSHSACLFKNGELAESFCEERVNGMEHEALHVMECLENGLLSSPMYPAEMTVREMECCDRLRARWGLVYPSDSQPLHERAPEAPAASEQRDGSADDWYRDAVFYHIYPLGMCGAPKTNDFSSDTVCRLDRVLEMTDYLCGCGFNAVYFGPLFESSVHGYDTADYRTVDRRLGDNRLFAQVCERLHSRGIRVVVDGVFNHVGRDFWAFRDVRENRHSSRYCGWFNLDFGSNSNYNDGFAYEGWEGHYDLVKLNLRNPEVKNYLFDTIRGWEEEFKIDGLRLDVAYCLDRDFICELRRFCKSLRPDFFLLGECVHGDYNQWVNDVMLDSVTNYECYKGIHSSINSGNMHEIGYSLHRQFGGEEWSLYRGLSLYSFVDNHDVSRIASILTEKENLPIAYALMYSMPGIPSVYYGSEFAMQGDKGDGDDALRPPIESVDVIAMHNQLTDYISRLNDARKQSKALCRGDYNQLYVQPKQLIFSRCFEDERVICAFNSDTQPHTAHFNANAGRVLDLITGQTVDFGGGLVIPPRTAFIGKVY